MNLQRIKSERGQSLVELSVSLVLLLILLAGIVDLGRAIIAYFVLQDAAEEGIVYGVGFPTDCNQITLRVRSDIKGQFVNASQTTVSITILGPDNSTYISCYTIPYAQVYAGKIMKIAVKYNFPITMPFLGSILGEQSIPMTITTNGTILRPPPPPGS